LWYILQPQPGSQKHVHAHEHRSHYFPQNLLDLTDLFLNFAGYLFRGLKGSLRDNSKGLANSRRKIRTLNSFFNNILLDEQKRTA
jgi:hypothetical protein